MSLKNFIKSKTFILSLVLAGAIVVLGLVWSYFYLDSYTRHGSGFDVPDLVHMDFEEAVEVLNEKNLNYSILDSSRYNPKFQAHAILEQNPKAGAKVKEGRNVYLTINKTTYHKFELAEELFSADLSRRGAEARIKAEGHFVVDRIEYIPYPDHDVVLGVKYRGKKMEAGDLIPQNSKITLLLGEGNEETATVDLPVLWGLSLERAKNVLLNYSLNLGGVSEAKNAEEGDTVLVYKQNPSPLDVEKIKKGTAIDLWLTTNKDLVPSDSLLLDLDKKDELGQENEDELENEAF